MSRYEWEYGKISLPSTATPTVRAAVRTAANNHRDAAAALVKTFWVDNARRTRSARVFSERLDNWSPRGDAAVIDDAYAVLSELRGAPRTPRRSDIDSVCAAMNTKSAAYETIWFSIRFAGRDVLWSVPENNRAVDSAHAHPVAVAFFEALSAVRWTRGSGGELIGNDEYNSESREAGAGGNYVTATFPPPVPAARRLTAARR